MRSLAITCGALWCNHQAKLDYPDDMAVPSFVPRMVCTVCGAIGADARPNWNELRRAVCLVAELPRLFDFDICRSSGSELLRLLNLAPQTLGGSRR